MGKHYFLLDFAIKALFLQTLLHVLSFNTWRAVSLTFMNLSQPQEQKLSECISERMFLSFQLCLQILQIYFSQRWLLHVMINIKNKDMFSW